MKKKCLSWMLIFALFIATISTGFGALGTLAASAPTGTTGAGISMQWLSGTAEVDKITLSSTSGTFSGSYTLKLTNNSTKTATVTSITASSSYLAFSTTSFTIASGGTKSITVTKGSGLTSASSGTAYVSNVVVNYKLEDVYQGGTSNLQSLTAKSSIGLEYIAAGAVANPYTKNAPFVGFEVHIKTKTTASGGWLETTTSDSGGAVDANVAGNYYVDLSKYTTWNGAGWKIASTESKGNNLEVNSSSCSISGTYDSKGSITISFPAIKENATVTASPTGTIPTGSTTSTSPAVLNYKATWKTIGWTGNNSGSLTAKINVYAYNKANLRTQISTCEEAGLLSCYLDSSLYSTYTSALSTARKILATTKTNNKAVNDAYTALKTAYTNLISASNRGAYAYTVTNTTYGAGDMSGTAVSSYVWIQVCKKSTATTIPVYEAYASETNRHTELKTVTLTSNSSGTYHYWTIDDSALSLALTNAKNILDNKASEYTADSIEVLQNAVNQNEQYAVTGSDIPENQSEMETYVTKVNDALNALQKVAALFVTNRVSTVTREGTTITMTSVLDAGNIAIQPTLTDGIEIIWDSLGDFTRSSDGRYVLKSDAENKTAQITLSDGITYTLNVAFDLSTISNDTIKTLYTSSAVVDNVNKEIILNSRDNMDYVVLYNVTTEGTAVELDCSNDEYASLYSTYRYKITKPASGVYTSTVKVGLFDYKLTVNFLPRLEISEENLRTLYTTNVAVDNQNRTITIDSRDRLNYIALYNTTVGDKQYAIEIQENENVDMYCSTRYKISGVPGTDYQTTAVINGVPFALTVRFLKNPVETVIKDWAYRLDGTNIILSKYTGTEEDIIIPATFTIQDTVYNTVIDRVELQQAEDGYYDPVSGPFYENQVIRSVRFSEGVTVLDNMAEYMFAYSSVQTVYNLPEGVTDIYGAFYMCDNLTTIQEIPATVVEMGWAFANSRNLCGEMTILAESVTGMDANTFRKTGLDASGLTILVKADSATAVKLPACDLNSKITVETF